MKQINVVISGFGPYADLSVNPSYEVPLALEQYSSQELDLPEDVRVNIKSVMLPISFANAWPQLLEMINAQDADIVIATGVKHTNPAIICFLELLDAQFNSL